MKNSIVMTRRNLLHIVAAAAFSVLLSSCGEKKESAAPQSLMEASRQELVDALEERDELLSLVKEISAGMEKIKAIEGIVTQAGSRSGEDPGARKRILAELTVVESNLKRGRAQLADLEKRLDGSALYTDELKGTVSALKGLLEVQARDTRGVRALLTAADRQIDSLSNRVVVLSAAVDEVTENLDSASASSVRLANELNTCYYVVARKSELKKHHILETPFLRKSRLMKGDFDRGFFITADKRNLRHIDLGKSRPKIHTNHPEGSYELSDSDGKTVLTVTDADRFWSLSNYLVIQTD